MSLSPKLCQSQHYGSNLTSVRCFTKAVYEPLIKSNDKRSCSYHPFSGGLLCKKENDAGFVISGCSPQLPAAPPWRRSPVQALSFAWSSSPANSVDRELYTASQDQRGSLASW